MSGDLQPMRHEQMRLRNVALILTLIQRTGGISRAELAQRLRLTKPAITRIVRDLIAAHILEEDNVVQTDTGGRPARLLVLRPGRFASVGVDLRIDRWSIILRDLSGEILIRKEEKCDPSPDPPVLLSQICETIIDLLREHPRELLGVGVSIGAQPNPEQTGVVRSPYLSWGQVDIRGYLRQGLQLPNLECVIHDVASAAALAHSLYEWDSPARDAAHIQCGIGLGLGLTLDHWMSLPRRLTATTVGHLPLREQGPLCPECGWRGCVDSVLGFRAIQQRFAFLGLVDADSPHFMSAYCQQIIEHLHSGDARVELELEACAQDLARLVVTQLSISGCERVTVGGWPLFLGEEFVARIERLARTHRLAEMVTVSISPMGDDAPLLGAAIAGAARVLLDGHTTHLSGCEHLGTRLEAEN